MSTKINLQSIRKYNPGLLKDEDVINNFLVRQKTFQSLIQQIKNEEQDSIPQHHLIIGQRGMGKTTLLKRIEVEVRQEAVLSTNFVPLQFPEELYNIDRLSKFWFNTIDVLIDYLETKNEKNLCNKFEKQMNKLTMGGEHSFSADEAYTLFMSMMSEIQKRPILLVDNLDLVFEGLNSDEQWQLREKMSKSGAPIFIGASASPFDAVFDYKQAFYDYFKLTTLDPLTYESFYELIITLAESLDDEKVKSSFYTNQNRIKTLFRLTGGNIRTAIILFSSLSSGFGTNVSDDLEKLLDEVTPIYKARIDELSDQMRIIADTVALYWDPIDLQKLRDITFLENNTLSPQIRRLRQMGWITKVPSSKTKGDKYEMTERFFNVWYLMRRSTRRHRKNITCLSRFIEEFYGEELHQIAMSLLSKGIASENEALFRLALSGTIKDKTLKEKFDTHTSDGINVLAESEPEIYGKLGLEKSNKLDIVEFYEIIDRNNFTEAEKWLYKKEEIFPDSEYLMFCFGYYHQFITKRYEIAEEFYLRSIKINDNVIETWNNLGNLYQYQLNILEKAKDAYENAININPENAIPITNLADFYQTKTKEYKKSENTYLRALELDPKFAFAWYNLGMLYQFHLKEYKKAEKAYLNALNANLSKARGWNGLGNLYHDNLKEYEKAKDAYFKAIQSDPNNIASKYNLIFLLRDILNQKDEALDMFKDVIIEKDNEILDTYFLHQSLFHVYDLNFGLASESLKLAIEKLENNNPVNTFDDWIRYASVAIKKGFGSEMLGIFREYKIDIIMRPYYEACVAYQYKDKDHFQDIAVEVRDIAKEIYEQLIGYSIR